MPASVATIQVRAVPNGRRAEVVGRYGEAWKIRVSAAPEKGRANDELVRFLSDVLAVPRGTIEVVRGHSSRDKLVTITGAEQAAVDARLGELAAA